MRKKYIPRRENRRGVSVTHALQVDDSRRPRNDVRRALLARECDSDSGQFAGFESTQSNAACLHAIKSNSGSCNCSTVNVSIQQESISKTWYKPSPSSETSKRDSRES